MVVPSYYPMPFWDTILSHLDRKVCKETLRNIQIFSVHIHFFRVALRSFTVTWPVHWFSFWRWWMSLCWFTRWLLRILTYGWTKSWTTKRMVKTCKPLITGAGFRNHPQYPKKVPDLPFWFPASWPLPELHGLTMRFAIQETKPCGKKQPNNKPFGVASTS